MLPFIQILEMNTYKSKSIDLTRQNKDCLTYISANFNKGHFSLNKLKYVFMKKILPK